jgi:hypothetical protein
MSSWVVLEAQHVGEVHLPLAAPLDEPHDLHLLTRLVDQPGDGAWCWATFDRIRITLDQG